VQKIRKMFKT